MEKATIIGIDLAKRAFQLHGVTREGRAVFRKKVSRGQLLSFLSAQPGAVVAMEACATAHDWGRSIAELGHEVRLIPPVYVKPFVRRQKNDAADAEAIAEAASRPSMRFVALKSEDQQAQAMFFRTRDLLVRQRTQLVNALRGHLAEHGIVAPYGLAKVKVLAAALGEGSVHPLVRDSGNGTSIISRALMSRSANSRRGFGNSVGPTRHRSVCRPCRGSAPSPPRR
jgi:transposase